MANRPSPLVGLTICINKVHEQRIRIEREKAGPMKGLAFEIHEVFDPGLNRWISLGRQRRPDLDHQLATGHHDHIVALQGDESRQEIDENIGVALDSDTDDWFKRRTPPDWVAIEKWVNDEYERRRFRRVGRQQFALGGSSDATKR